jgi:nicotinamide mononucleotide transporter
MSPFEIAAFLFTGVSVWLSVKQHIASWPTAIVGVGLYSVVCWDAKLYADMGLQVVYLVLSIYGWYEWLHGGEDHGRLAVSRTPVAWGLALLAAGTLFTVGFGLFLKLRTDAALPYPDAATTGFSLVAQWMTTRKWLENWLLWIVVDAAYVLICISQRLFPMAALYAVFLAMAVIGYKEWRTSMARGGAALEPQETP